MARAKYITNFERDVIRIGHSRGVKAPTIARFLGRTKNCVYRHIEEMKQDGTIANVPFGFVTDEIAESMKSRGNQNG